MRAANAEDAATRAKQETRRLTQELHTASDALNKLESDVAAREQGIHALEGKALTMGETIATLERDKAASELKVARLQSRHEAEAKRLNAQIEKLK